MCTDINKLFCKAVLKPFLSKGTFIRKLHIDDVVVNNKFQGRRACNVYNNHDPFHAMFFNTQKRRVFFNGLFVLLTSSKVFDQ